MNFLTILFGGLFVLMGLMVVINLITAGRWLVFKYGPCVALGVFLIAYQIVVRPCIRWHEETEKRAAEHFIEAWMAESADFTAGIMNTDEWHKFVDRNRSVDIDPYLATAYQMTHSGTVKYEGKENVLTGNGEEVPSKVFVVPVTILEAAKCNLFDCNVRLWVSRDHKKVLKIVCQDYKAIQ